MSEQTVKEIISDQLGVKDIMDVNNIREDLGADSLDFVELTMAIEEAFHIEISDEDAEKIKTVGDMAAYVKAHIK